MMRERSAFLIALLAALLVVGLLSGAQAQGTSKIAIINMGRVTDEYKALQDRQTELGAWLEGKRTYVGSLAEFLYLSADGFNEAADLLKTAPLPDDRKKRLDDLQALALDKHKQYLDLRAKVQRTTQEDETYKTLSDLSAANGERLTALQTQLSGEYNQQIETARNQFMKNVEDVARTMATTDGYDLVLDSSMVLVGGADITDKVLAKLNGGAAPVAPAAGGG
jgi:Skp family chaperone for outer membrane proteins